MSSIQLVSGSCIEQHADVVVNAANPWLDNGGGICGAIFEEAGENLLERACESIKTPVQVGQAVITSSFNLKPFKAIIHAIGPDFRESGASLASLRDAYYNALIKAMENDFSSVSFPLISSSIYAGTLKNAPGESAKQCFKAYERFLSDYPDYDIKVILCAYKNQEYESARIIYEEYLNKRY
ncbi:MAG: macro domain-containing protein [Bacilli bacterium]|nr:macro domain-containing protein [Bacilli bacterium]